MKPVKMHEAKTNFSRLIGLVDAGALKDQISLADDVDALPEGFEGYAG